VAGPNNINILISVKNQASGPLRQVRKEVTDFRNELVQFNRRLFTASAVYATFTQAFRKAFDFAAVGADFDMFRSRFESTFDESYLKRLRIASKGTMDAMSMMQLSIQNHARGLKQAETEKIFTLSVGAAKLLGTSTSQAASKMSKALHGLSVTGMQQFMVALNTNNQFKNMDVMIKRLTKGLNSAGMETTNFRRIALRELEIALGEISAETGDAKTLFMQLGASTDSVRQVFGSFLSRAVSPLAAGMARLNWDLFDKFNDILSNSNKQVKNLREGLVDFAQMGGGIVGATAGLVGGLSLLALAGSTLGVTFGGVVGLLSLFLVGMKKAKDGSGGFLQAISNFGTALKFWYQAFTSYQDGVSTFSGEVMGRLNKMDESSRNRIVFIAKMFVLARSAIDGFTDGIKNTINFATKLLTTFGLFDAKTKQFSKGFEDFIKGSFKALGAMATVWALFKGVGAVKGMLSKIPGVGRLFGGGGGAPKGNASDPIYTRSADGLLGGAGGALGGMTSLWTTLTAKHALTMGNVLKVGLGSAGWLAAAGAAGYGVGTMADQQWDLSGKIADALFKSSAGANAGKDLLGSNKGQAGALNRATMDEGFTASAQNFSRAKNLAGLVSQMESKGGSFDTESLKKLTSGGLNIEETNTLIENIYTFLRNNKPNQFVTKLNAGS